MANKQLARQILYIQLIQGGRKSQERCQGRTWWFFGSIPTVTRKSPRTNGQRGWWAVEPEAWGLSEAEKFSGGAAGDTEYRRGQPGTGVCRSGSAKPPGNMAEAFKQGGGLYGAPILKVPTGANKTMTDKPIYLFSV